MAGNMRTELSKNSLPFYDCKEKQETIVVDLKNKETIIVDLGNRDEKRLNDILKGVTNFNDVIGETEPNVFTNDRVYVASYHSYTFTKFWCYKILTFLFAVPCAIWWALTFACCSFCRIWCCVPCVKCLQIQCFSCGQVWELYVLTFLHPLFDAFSRLCSRIRIALSSDILNWKKFEDVHDT